MADLPVAVREVADQKLACEFLILDNASAVAVPSASELAAELTSVERERITITVLHSDERLPIGTARNLLLARASAPHLVMHDSDDLLFPGVWAFLLGRVRERGLASAAALSLKSRTDATYWRQALPAHLWTARHTRWTLFWANMFAQVLAPGPAAVHSTAALRMIGGAAELPVGEDYVMSVALPLVGPCELHRRWGRLWIVRNGSLWHCSHSVDEMSAIRAAVIARIAGMDPPWHVRALMPYAAARLRAQALSAGEQTPSETVPAGSRVTLADELDKRFRARLEWAQQLRSE